MNIEIKLKRAISLLELARVSPQGKSIDRIALRKLIDIGLKVEAIVDAEILKPETWEELIAFDRIFNPDGTLKANCQPPDGFEDDNLKRKEKS